MKTALISLFTATVMGFASRASGYSFDAAEFTGIFFATGLMAWTLSQYSRTPRSLNAARPIRLPRQLNSHFALPKARRLAA